MLETTNEEYLTPQQKVFVSVFSIKFSLAGYHVFNSVNPHRIRFECTHLTEIPYNYF